MAQRDCWHLGSPGMWVPSPVWHSGLRIQRCCTCGLGLNCDSDLAGLGAQKKKKKKKKKDSPKAKHEIPGREGYSIMSKGSIPTTFLAKDLN